MTQVHILIDADSCPRMVRDYVLRYSKRLSIPVTFAANRIIPAEKEFPFHMEVCGKESGAADDYIVNTVEKYDMVITRDIPLAARLVEKEITVLNDRGTVYTKENIRERLSERNFSLQLEQIGLGGSKADSYGKKEFSAFANTFDREIHKLIKQNNLHM